jgi:subtilisin-like proprotein convertase family protein
VIKRATNDHQVPHIVRHLRPAGFRGVLILGVVLAAALGAAGSRLAANPQSPSNQEPSGNGIAPEGMAQIEALLREKETRSPAELKIDSQLLYASRMQQGLPVAPGVQTIEVDLPLAADGHVIVDVKANVTTKLLADMRGFSNEVVRTSAGDLQAHVALEDLEAIASQPDVIWIQAKQASRNSRSGSSSAKRRTTPSAPAQAAAIQALGQAPSGPIVNSVGTGRGSVTTQADITHRSAVFRGLTGFNGAGVKIGVLSDGVDHLADAQASGDLGSVIVLPGQAGSGDQGTSMLETIYDMAPGAQLYFATAGTSVTSFAQNIRDLRNAGCDIIVDDTTYFVESPFQDGQAPAVVSPTNGGVVTQAVRDVAAGGALYFSAAGNNGNDDYGTSGVWQGDFNLGAATGAPLPAGGNFHRFTGSQDFNTLTTAGSATISLFWSDPLGGSGNDYDLFRLNSAGTIVSSSSTNVQNGNDDPYEQVSANTANPRIVVVRKTGAASRFLHLNTNGGQLSAGTSGQMHGHAATSNLFSFGVAATSAALAYPSPHDFGDNVETFTSDGLRRIFFLDDGSAITPGNFSATGGAALQKPDFTAADDAFVTGAGDAPGRFVGTEASAASAAAIMALLKSQNPGFTQAQLRSALFATAQDIGVLGVDRDSGAGIIMATPRQVDCTFSLSPLSLSPGLSGGPGAITVTASSGTCNWVAWSTVPWMAVTANVGTGNGSFNYTVDPNPGPSRSGTLMIQGGAIVVVTQAGISATTFDNNVSLAIPDQATVESSITVSGVTGAITNVTASFFITHTFDDDLVLQLVGPDGTIVPLSVENGGNANNYGSACSPLSSRTTFDDSATNYITHGSAPFTGSFRPEKPLAALNGKSGAAVNGVWKLRITDGFDGETGSLSCWSLNINTAMAAPATTTATATSPSAVTVTWALSPGATSYEVQRSAGGGIFESRGTLASPPLMDTASPNTAYLYRVRVTAPVTTGFGGNELATTVIFTDPALSSSIAVKAPHVTELRTAVNAVRVLSGAGALAFSDPTLTPPGSVMIKALHMSQLRGVLDVARAALGLPAVVYGFPATAGSLVRAADVNDLRNGVK